MGDGSGRNRRAGLTALHSLQLSSVMQKRLRRSDSSPIMHSLSRQCVCFLALFTAAVFAHAQSESTKPFAAPETVDRVTAASATGLVEITLALLVVLASVFAAAWLMQRLRTISRGRAGAVKIVADVSLGPKERAVLVQVGEQQLLLGVAPGQVSTLHVLSQPVASEPDISTALTAEQQPDFKSILRRSLGLR